MNESTVELLEHVLATPKTTEAAMRELAERLEIEPEQSFALHFARLMARLEAFGLVVRA